MSAAEVEWVWRSTLSQRRRRLRSKSE